MQVCTQWPDDACDNDAQLLASPASPEAALPLLLLAPLLLVHSLGLQGQVTPSIRCIVLSIAVFLQTRCDVKLPLHVSAQKCTKEDHGPGFQGAAADAQQRQQQQAVGEGSC